MALKQVYKQIVEDIIGRIESKEVVVGEMLESEIFLAKRYDVSRGTVRKAILDLEKAGYLQPSQRGKRRVVALGNREKIGVKEKRVALFLPSDKEYFTTIKNEAFRLAKSCEWSLDLFYNYNENEEWRKITTLIDEGYDGAIIMPYFAKGHDVQSLDIQSFNRLKKANIPFVLLCKPIKNFFCNAVYVDDYKASYDITKRLIYKKCNEIVHITADKFNVMVRDERMHGCISCCEKFKVTYVDTFSFDIQAYRTRFLEYVRSTDNKIGVNLYSDEYFPQVKKIFDECGKKHGVDYEAITFFEQNLSEKSGLDFVQVPKEQIVRSAVKVLYEQMFKEENTRINHVIYDIYDL